MQTRRDLIGPVVVVVAAVAVTQGRELLAAQRDIKLEAGERVIVLALFAPASERDDAHEVKRS